MEVLNRCGSLAVWRCGGAPAGAGPCPPVLPKYSTSRAASSVADITTSLRSGRRVSWSERASARLRSVARLRSWNSSNTTAATPRKADGKQHPWQDALRDEAQAGLCGYRRLEARLKADLVAEPTALVRHALRQHARGQPLRLQDEDLATGEHAAGASSRNCGACVDLPEPVGAASTIRFVCARAVAKSRRILKMGSASMMRENIAPRRGHGGMPIIRRIGPIGTDRTDEHAIHRHKKRGRPETASFVLPWGMNAGELLRLLLGLVGGLLSLLLGLVGSLLSLFLALGGALLSLLGLALALALGALVFLGACRAFLLAGTRGVGLLLALGVSLVALGTFRGLGTRCGLGLRMCHSWHKRHRWSWRRQWR